MIEINHNLFGHLSYDLYWTREIKVNIFNHEKTVILSIYGEEDGLFLKSQEDAYTNFILNMDTIMKDAEVKIFEYYQEICMEYREMVGVEDADKIAPIIHDKAEMKDLVTLEEIVINRAIVKNIREVGLLFECTWEEEHGMGVKIENEQITEVEYQDIVL